MSNFNSADIAAFKDVWVFCEQREGKLMPTDFELISKGRDLANELGVNLCGLLLGGEGIESAAKELGGYGADKVYVCESPLLGVYNTDAYAKVICDVIEDLKPEAFLIGATNIGRDLGPRCAARLHTGLCADCTHLDVDVANYIQFLREASTLDVDAQKWDMEDRNLKMTRPAFGGHLMATIICPRFRPCMATVRPGVMKKNAFDEAKAAACEIVKPAFTLTEADLKTEVVEVVKAAKKLVDLIGATNIGRDLAPRCAARLHTGLCADCTHLDVDVANYIQFLREASTLDVDAQKWDMEDRNLKMTRPAFGGHLMATIICPRFRPCMATVRPGVMKKNAFDEAKATACVIEKPAFSLTEADLKTEVVEVVKAAKKLVDLIGADYIVSVGRGISKDVEGGIKLAEELAEVLGGVVGGSRATIDSGWLSADHQVGQTGKTVHPKVYIALGISGAIQHKAGMQDSECIIAVNKNDTAPIFEIADYGICGDLFKVTPLLIEAIKAAKAAK